MALHGVLSVHGPGVVCRQAAALEEGCCRHDACENSCGRRNPQADLNLQADWNPQVGLGWVQGFGDCGRGGGFPLSTGSGSGFSHRDSSRMDYKTRAKLATKHNNRDRHKIRCTTDSLICSAQLRAWPLEGLGGTVGLVKLPGGDKG